MATEEFYDEIERYLNGTLNGEKKKAFEERMKTDKKFREEVNLHKDLSTFLGDPEEKAFHDNIKKIGENYKTFSAPKNHWSWLKFLLPLAVLGIGVWWCTQSKTKTPVDKNKIESTINTTTKTKDSKTKSEEISTNQK